MVLSDEDWEHWEDEVEANLRVILSNKELAEICFPNEKIRKNILPFFLHMRNLGKQSRQEKS